nr:cation diffusion facilitator family transporter [Cryobacterium zhongshanensis]
MAGMTDHNAEHEHQHAAGTQHTHDHDAAASSLDHGLRGSDPTQEAGHSHPHSDGLDLHHPHDDHDHDHGPGGHSHPTGIKGFLYGLFVPHTHDAADSIDDAMEASVEGVRALKISLVVLLVTTILQFAVVLISGSVALFADTIHNFSDALTAVPLWIAFILGRRAASRRYTFGYGRAEDLAGLFIIVVVLVSAIVAGWQSIDRLFHPQPLHNIGWVIVAGVIGFLGNEAVAVYRIRIGRKIGSAALVADGVHARTDGFTSLAVVVGGVGVLLGFPLADPIVGIVISVAIMILLIGTVRSIGRRLLDSIEPDLIDRAERALREVDGVVDVNQLQLRWVGHRLHGAAEIVVPDDAWAGAESVVHEAEHHMERAMPNLDHMAIRVATVTGATL